MSLKRTYFAMLMNGAYEQLTAFTIMSLQSLAEYYHKVCHSYLSYCAISAIVSGKGSVSSPQFFFRQFIYELRVAVKTYSIKISHSHSTFKYQSIQNEMNGSFIELLKNFTA